MWVVKLWRVVESIVHVHIRVKAVVVEAWWRFQDHVVSYRHHRNIVGPVTSLVPWYVIEGWFRLVYRVHHVSIDLSVVVELSKLVRLLDLVLA